MKTRYLALGAVVALVAGSVALAGSWGPGWGPPGMGPGMGPRIGLGIGPGAVFRLGLTQEQADKLRAMDEAFWQEVQPLREELLANRDEMRELWASPNPDAQSLSAKQKELQQLQAQLQQKGFQHLLERREVLTPEQRQELGTFGHGPRLGPGPRFGGPWGQAD